MKITKRKAKGVLADMVAAIDEDSLASPQNFPVWKELERNGEE